MSSPSPATPPRQPPVRRRIGRPRAKMRMLGVDHVQITVPGGQEETARRFYCGILGLREIEKPQALRGRGGLWLLAGDSPVHVGVEGGIERAATKAHVAYRVQGIDAWREHLHRLGVVTLDSVPIPGYRRCELHDPFGNRLELIEESSE